MKVSHAVVSLYGITSTVSAAALPDLSRTSLAAPLEYVTNAWPVLTKRRGGGGSSGGGGGRSSGGSSSSSSSSSSSGSSSGSRSGSSSGSSGSSGATRGSSSSNTGGSTTTGSGAPRSYGGGSYYGGGATVPYRAGSRSPLGVAPFLLFAPALVLGSAWAYGAYAYPYGSPYSFRNGTTNRNETLPVQCWCQQYSTCGCEDNTNSTYIDQIIGNGTNLNTTIVNRVNLNGTDTLVINGTLPNGTTAAGGTDSPDSEDPAFATTSTSGARSIQIKGWAALSGWWVMLVTVVGIITTV